MNPYIEGVTERFADAGFDAVAPAFFHRAGGGTAPYDDFTKVFPLYEGLTDDGILMDLDAAFAHLSSLGHEPAAIGVVGFCFGGRVTFLAAARRAFGAAVGFYGGGLVTRASRSSRRSSARAPTLQTPWLGLFGDEDGSIPVEDVETLRTALVAAPVPTEIVRYPGAEHGFFCDERPSLQRGSVRRCVAPDPRLVRSARAVTEFERSDHCDLCEAARITPWFHEDDVCWIAECEICAVPMVVWRHHGVEPPPEHLEHMHGQLAVVGASTSSSSTTSTTTCATSRTTTTRTPAPRAASSATA